MIIAERKGTPLKNAARKREIRKILTLVKIPTKKNKRQQTPQMKNRISVGVVVNQAMFHGSAWKIFPNHSTLLKNNIYLQQIFKVDFAHLSTHSITVVN